MSSQSEHPVSHAGAPAWNHPTEAALWRLATVLREISQNPEPPEKKEAPGQASPADPLTPGSKQDSADE